MGVAKELSSTEAQNKHLGGSSCRVGDSGKLKGPTVKEDRMNR